MEETIKRKLIRIAIVGPESTGKTTLAMQLADHYKTAFVPEFAREYLNGINRPYTLEDIITISKGQMITEDEIAARASRLLICDTNLVVTKIWAENSFKQCPEWISESLKTREYDLYLLCHIDIPWVADPQREHPQLREYLFKKYEAELAMHPTPYVIISGLQQARAQNAIKEIDKVLKLS